VLTLNGPRTDVADVATTAYYADDDPDPAKRGNVASVTNALGHTTLYNAYNAHGQPLTIVDANGLANQPRLRRAPAPGLSERGRRGDELYLRQRGQTTKVTLPDGSFLAYSYDAAHRLTGMSDSLGNRIAYTLDAMGNRTQEAGVRSDQHARPDAQPGLRRLNRLAQELGAQSQTTQYAYDTQGNVTSVTDALNRATSNQYDALNRLIRITDPSLGQTQYAYNGIDTLVSVTDPRNLATTYNYDASRISTPRSRPTPAPPPAPTTPRGTCSPKPTPRAKRPPTPTTP